MKRFFPILKRINERLVLPQPQKYRIMKEISADLEDTFAAYIKKGVTEDEAEAKALEKIAADDGVIEQLMEVHESPVRKILRRLSEKAQHRIEITLWVSLLLVAGILISGMMVSSGMFAGSVFNLFIGALIMCMVGISVAKYYDLYIKRDHMLHNIHRGLSLLIFISFMAIMAGTLGFFVELQESLRNMCIPGAEDFDVSVDHLFSSLTVISFSFTAAIVGAVLWLIMTMKTLSIEDHEHAFIYSETKI